MTTTTAIIDRDEATGTTPNRYHYTRTVEIAGRTVRAHVERDYYLNQSRAVAEVLNDQMTWTRLAADAPSNWWDSTPYATSPVVTDDPARILRPVAERLLHRAAAILAPPTPAPTVPVLSPRVLDAVSALLATSYGYDSEREIDPDEIAWAKTYGGALHIIEHPDGSVTFTKHHRDDCPFITSAGKRDCDEACCYKHPAGVDRKLAL